MEDKKLPGCKIPRFQFNLFIDSPNMLAYNHVINFLIAFDNTFIVTGVLAESVKYLFKVPK